jgi:hypothetical protein
MTGWLGVCMCTHLTFKEHYNQCLKKVRTMVVGLNTLTRVHGFIPKGVMTVKIACAEGIVQYESEFWRDSKEFCSREELQILIKQLATFTVGALPIIPLSSLRRDSGLTPVPIALVSRQTIFSQASKCMERHQKEEGV